MLIIIFLPIMNIKKINLPYQDFGRTNNLPVDYQIGDQYTIIKCLGNGNYGTVFKAQDKLNNRIVAIKIINMVKILKNTSNKDVQKLLRMSVTEPMHLQIVNSPYVAKYYEHMQNQQSTLKLLVMEYCDGQTLEIYISQFVKQGKMLDQKQALDIFYDIVKGIEAIHDKKIMHRDLHPGNIIKNGDRWVIVDLGFSKMVAEMQSIKKQTSLGALIIKAPQIINPKAKYGLKADIWSLGVNLFFLLTNRYLFTEQQCELRSYEILQLIKKRLKIQFYPDENQVTEMNQEQCQRQQLQNISILSAFKVHQKYKIFLKQILQFQSSERFSAKQLIWHRIFDDQGIRSTKEKGLRQNPQTQQTKNGQQIKQEQSQITYNSQCEKWLSSTLSKQY